MKAAERGGRRPRDEEEDDDGEEEEEVPPPDTAGEAPTEEELRRRREEEDREARCSPPAVLLNIPKVVPQPPPPSAEVAKPVAVPVPVPSSSAAPDESIGEFDDGRSGKLTLSILIQEGLIEPGDGVLTIDYLGQTFKGDLMAAGKIRSQETGLIFNNPSAWAIYCKKIVNPAKKSGCGWASVKYKGRKMDHFKTQWTKMKAKRDAEEAEKREEEEAAARTPEAAALAAQALEAHGVTVGSFPQILRHSQLGLKPLPTTNVMPGGGFVAFPEPPPPQAPPPDPESPIEPETFVSQGRLQPFTLSVSSSALLLVDVHAHTSAEPVVGYLAGHWDLNAHNLAITHAFPCLVDAECAADGDDEEAKNELAARTEYEIYNAIYSKHLSLVGWYKTCPQLPRALPTLKDSEAQLDFQVKLLGQSDATYTPCVGLAVRPFANLQNESDMGFYWVVPPPESSPMEYGKPMKMQHTMVQDPCLSEDVLEQIDSVLEFYKKKEKSPVHFDDDFNSDTKLVTKMGRSLLPKFPRDQDERLWRHIRVGVLGEKIDADLPDPLISHASFGEGNNGEGNGAMSAVARLAGVNGFDAAEDEEEIDDDEDGALMRRGGSAASGRRGSRTISTHSSNNGLVHGTAPVATTDEVISMLLQRQAPVAPMAHGASQRVAEGSAPNDDEAPLDFSASSNR